MERFIKALKEYGPWGLMAILVILILGVMFCEWLSCRFQGWLGTDKKGVIEYLGWAIGGVIATYGLFKLEQRAQAQSKGNELVAKGHEQDRFKAATDHLGDESPRLRIASFYEFYHLVRINPEYREGVFDILISYWRQISRKSKSNKKIPYQERASLLEVLFGKNKRIYNEELYVSFWRERFSGMNMRGVNLKNAYLREADLRKSILRDAKLQGVNMRGARLWKADMRGARLWKADMRGAKLWKADMRGAKLWKANMRDAKLQGVNMRGARLWRVDMEGADLRKASLIGAQLQKSNMPGLNFTETEIEDANFHDAFLPDAEFQDVLAPHVDFRKANLNRAQFQNAYLMGVKFQNAGLVDAQFNGAYLRRAILSNANVERADFQDADLRGADMQNMQNYHSANFKGAKYNKKTIAPDKFINLSTLRMILMP